MTSSSFLHNLVYVIIYVLHFESYAQFGDWCKPVMVASTAGMAVSKGQCPQYASRW
jgi:hypothetical protein